MASKRPVAVLKAPKPIDKFIFRVRALIINVLLNSGYFLLIVPTPAIVTANVDDLETKQGKVVAKIVGAGALRNLQLALVKTNVNDWVAAIQSLADNSPTVETAIAIIQAAGLEVKINGVRVKAPLQQNVELVFQVLLF